MMMDEDGDDTLTRVLALPDATREQIDALRAYLHLTVLEGDEALHEEGQPVDCLTAVVSGRLATVGETAFLQEYGRGDWVGAQDFLTQQASRRPVIALRESVVLKLNRDDFPFALHACPALWQKLMPGAGMAGPANAPIARARPALLAVLKAGGDHQLPGALAEALSMAFESLGDIRFIRTSIFGGDMPGAISLDTAQAQHWLQEQELAFDLTIIPVDPENEASAMQLLKEADEILLILDEGALPELAQSKFVQHAFQARGKSACRVVTLAPQTPQKSHSRVELPPLAAECRSYHRVVQGSADGFTPLARLMLGEAASVAAVSSGAHAAAISGALRALEDSGLRAGLAGAAGSATLPVSLFAAHAAQARVESIFEGLAQTMAHLKRHAFRADYSLFNPRPVDEYFVSTFPDVDIANLDMPLLIALTDLSTRSGDLYRTGKLRGLTRSSILPPGILPPLVTSSGKILVSGESRADELVRHLGALNAGPLLVLETQTAPLGPASLGYNDLVAGPIFRLPGRTAAPPPAPRLSFEAQLCELEARNRAAIPRDRRIIHWTIPLPEGITPLDWKSWRLMHDMAYEWTQARLAGLQVSHSAIFRPETTGEAA